MKKDKTKALSRKMEVEDLRNKLDKNRKRGELEERRRWKQIVVEENNEDSQTTQQNPMPPPIRVQNVAKWEWH